MSENSEKYEENVLKVERTTLNLMTGETTKEVIYERDQKDSEE